MKTFKKYKKILISFLVICVMLSMSACVNDKSLYDIALVTDIGQLMDAGFNQGTWEGIKEFSTNKNKKYNYYIPDNGALATDDDKINAMEKAIKDGVKIIVVPGYGQANAIEKVAKEHENVKFVFVDGWSLDLPNVVAINYKEEESGYIAGYLAVMEGYKKIGGMFGGGGTNPACNRFGYGYVQGAVAAAKVKQTHVDIRYSYQYGEGFAASDDLERMADKWYSEGTEIIFVCGGSMFYSVKRAAEKTKKGKIIGVDVDQSSLSTRVVTSAIKGLAVSVQKVLNQYYMDEWSYRLAGRAINLGANDDATGIPYNTSRLKKFTRAQYENVLERIKNGMIQIDTNLPDDCNDMYWLKNLYKNETNVTIIFE